MLLPWFVQINLNPSANKYLSLADDDKLNAAQEISENFEVQYNLQCIFSM